jgi:hypothetical protein
MPAIVTTSASTNTNNPTLLAAIQEDLSNHWNLTRIKNILNQLLLIGNNDPNKSLEIINALVNYIKSGFLGRIFNHFSNISDSSWSRLDDYLKKLLLELCAQFLLAYDELANPNQPNYASLNNYSETFNNYFIFLDRLFAIPRIINLSLDDHSDNVGLIYHSEKLLEDLIARSANTTSNEKSVSHFFNTLTNAALALGLNTHSPDPAVSATAQHVSGIEEMAGSLYTRVKGKVNDSLLTDAIGKYSFKLKDGNKEEAKQHCLDLFARTCLQDPLVVTTVQNIINTVATLNGTMSPSTDLLLTEAMLTQSVVEPTTLTSSSVQANVTLSPNNSTRNATEVDTTWNNTSNYLMPSIPELMAAAGHGIGNGVINAMSQQLAEYLNRAGYSGSQLSARALNLATLLAHSAYAASLPLILAALQNPDETDENAKDEMWQKVIAEVIPTFMTGLVFSLGFQGLNYFNRGYLSRFPTVKAVVQTIPVVSTAYAAISAPISTAVNIGAAATSSVLTKSAFHLFFPAPKKNTSESIEAAKEEVEINLLAKSGNQSQQAGEEPRKYTYITEENLETVRDNSEKLKAVLESLVTSLKQSIESDEKNKETPLTSNIINEYEKSIGHKNYILQELNGQLNKVVTLHERLMDENHKNACKIHTDYDTYIRIMGETANVFKLMQNFYEITGCETGNSLRDSINKISGYVEAQKESLAETVLVELNKIPPLLDTLLSLARNFSAIYSAKEAGYKGEERGALKAERLTNNRSTATILREKNNGEGLVTYNASDCQDTYNYYSSASNSSSGSTTLSTLSASSACDPVDPQQQQPLLKLSR